MRSARINGTERGESKLEISLSEIEAIIRCEFFTFSKMRLSVRKTN